RVGADDVYLAYECALQAGEARRREAAFDGRTRPTLRGRPVVIADDRIDTGATAIAAIRSTRRSGAERVVLAVPVGAPDRVAVLRDEADAVVCLVEDPRMLAVGH